MSILHDRHQIESKLEKEKKKLESLKSTINKYHDLTKSMSKILTTFEQRLGKLEQTILPVYNETENLQNRQHNLDLTLDCLQTVLAHYDSSQELCNLIHVGPADGQIGTFLGALNKLKVAKDYFLNNNTQSVELQNVTSLFNSGCETLNTHYRNVLRKHCNPMPAVQLLDLICIVDNADAADPAFAAPMAAISVSFTMQYPPADTRDELNTVANWLDNNLRREYILIYVEERAAVVSRSLVLLKDYQRSCSWGEHDGGSAGAGGIGGSGVGSHGHSSSSSIGGGGSGALKSRSSYGTLLGVSSSSAAGSGGFGRKSTSARLQAIFEKKTNKMLQRVENTTGISIKKSTGSTVASVSSAGLSGMGFVSGSDGLMPHDEHYMEGAGGDQELDKYLMLLIGLQRLLLRERQLLFDVIPKPRHQDIFSRLSQPSIEMVVRDAESITARVLKNIARKEWSAALGVFSALKHVILLQPDIDLACDRAQRAQLANVQQTFVQTGMKTLEHFLGLVKYDSAGSGTSSLVAGMASGSLVSGGGGSGSNSVPSDGTVHELTSNTIWFMEHLYEYSDVIGVVLQENALYTSQLVDGVSGTGGAGSGGVALSSEDRNRALLGLYIKKVLSELNLTIVTKCEQYGDLATRNLFRLNNIHYILKSLQRTKLIEVLQLTEPDCEKYYEELIRELKSAYQKSWTRLIGHITPLEDLPRPVNGRVKDKERAILKERFTAFNKDLEDAYKTQQAISIPDVSLRNCLKRDNVEHIIPQYNSFFHVYEEVVFSRHPEKYLKYRPQDVSSMLNKFFDDRV